LLFDVASVFDETFLGASPHVAVFFFYAQFCIKKRVDAHPHFGPFGFISSMEAHAKLAEHAAATSYRKSRRLNTQRPKRKNVLYKITREKCLVTVFLLPTPKAKLYLSLKQFLIFAIGTKLLSAFSSPFSHCEDMFLQNFRNWSFVLACLST